MDYTQLTLAIRTNGVPESVISSVKSQIWTADKNLPVFEVQTMEQVIDSSTSQRRFESFVLGIFAGLALILASIGLYGVLASLVVQRRNEIGIRIALGAESKHVMRLILGEGFQMVVFGLVIGIAGGIALSRLLASLFFGISSTNPITYLEIALLMLFVAAVACALPAWRALRINPVEALRYE